MQIPNTPEARKFRKVIKRRAIAARHLKNESKKHIRKHSNGATTVSSSFLSKLKSIVGVK